MQDYETTIKTDLVFHPKIISPAGGQVQEFMRYALIADRQISIGAQEWLTVDGNVYAGADFRAHASTGGRQAEA